MAKKKNAGSTPDFVNLLGQGSSFTGDRLDVDADLNIGGTVQADVTCNGRLVVEQEGVVEGNVVAEQVTVRGRINGDIDAGEKLAVTAGARVTGRIRAKKLTVEPGAICNILGNIGENDRSKELWNRRMDELVPPPKPQTGGTTGGRGGASIAGGQEQDRSTLRAEQSVSRQPAGPPVQGGTQQGPVHPHAPAPAPGDGQANPVQGPGDRPAGASLHAGPANGNGEPAGVAPENGDSWHVYRAPSGAAVATAPEPDEASLPGVRLARIAPDGTEEEAGVRPYTPARMDRSGEKTQQSRDNAEANDHNSAADKGQGRSRDDGDQEPFDRFW